LKKKNIFTAIIQVLCLPRFQYQNFILSMLTEASCHFLFSSSFVVMAFDLILIIMAWGNIKIKSRHFYASL